MKRWFVALLFATGCAVDPEPPVEICDNGIDDDANGLADCYDVACASECPESCDDARDDDGDGLVDCDDPDCTGVCLEDCADGIDDDADGKVDCDDLDCVGSCSESCANGVDDDGDLLVDSQDPSCQDADGDGVWSDVDCDDADPAVGAPAAWFTDADGDGHGDPARQAAEATCELPGPGTGPGDDCADNDPERYPGAREVCLDGVDQDCDAVDPACLDGDLGVGAAEGVISVAFEEENIGSSGAIVDGALLAGGLGRAWLFPAPLLGVLDSTAATEIPLDIAGRPSVSSAGDGRLAIGSPDTGQVWILDAATPAVDAAIASIQGGGGFGRAIASGSVDDDGYPDLLVRSDGVDLARLVRGPVFGSLDSAEATTATFTGITGTSADLPGDLDGDGLGDAVVAADDEIAIFVAPMGGNRPLDSADATALSAGQAVVGGAGDLDGDGLVDVLATDPGVDSAYLLTSLPAVPTPLDGAAVAEIAAPGLAHAIGLGDVDGDGTPEIATQGSSYVWIFTAPLAGSVDQTTALATLVPDSPTDQLGTVLLATDANGDGLGDAVLGAPHADTMATGSGAFYVFLGTTP